MPKQPSKDANGSASKKKKTEPTETPAIAGQLSKYQAFTAEDVHRSQLKNAPYNPRHITAKAKVKLREALENVGLVQPLVWNKRSGNLVGGHQRLTQLDALEGTADYFLTVAVVDVDDARERELNVLLNNGEVCGDWDLDKLKEILTDEDVKLLNTGFDQAEFMKLFGEAPSNSAPEHQTELADQLKDVNKAYEKMATANRSKDDTDFYNVVVFGSTNERKEFLDALGLEDNRYIDGRTIMKIVIALKSEASTAKTAETSA